VQALCVKQSWTLTTHEPVSRPSGQTRILSAWLCIPCRRAVIFLKVFFSVVVRLSASVLKKPVRIRSPLGFEKNSRRIGRCAATIKNEETNPPGCRERNHRIATQEGRLTARERIAKLLDPGSQFLIGILRTAAYEMYEQWGGAREPERSLGLAKVCGRTFMLIAMTRTVKAGAFFP